VRIAQGHIQVIQLKTASDKYDAGFAVIAWPSGESNRWMKHMVYSVNSNWHGFIVDIKNSLDPQYLAAP
jgi:hypothetical protein